jgi:hypothetical protein
VKIVSSQDTSSSSPRSRIRSMVYRGWAAGSKTATLTKRRVIQSLKFYFADVGVVNHLALLGAV